MSTSSSTCDHRGCVGPSDAAHKRAAPVAGRGRHELREIKSWRRRKLICETASRGRDGEPRRLCVVHIPVDAPRPVPASQCPVWCAYNRRTFLALTANTRLGPYEVLAPIGTGGMAEVYGARDTRLNRDVALKILPAAVALDAERQRRFVHEARAVSALNHPNILAVYDVGIEAGCHYLVSELIDGAPLTREIERGALPVK